MENGNLIYSEYFSIIQNVINRMAQNSFLIKAWSVTLIAAIFILTFSLINFIIFGVLAAISLIFWILDSYYLKLERLYRRLYDSKVTEFNDTSRRNKMRIFDMDYKLFEKEEQTILRIMRSKSEILFYLPILSALIAFLIISLIVL